MRFCKKDKKESLPFVHHACEVKGSGCEHHMDVVAKDALIKGAAQAVVCFQMTNDRFKGCPSAEVFLWFILLIAGHLLRKRFRYLNKGIAYFTSSLVASVSGGGLECTAG
ncbi:MAG: hypothetical protein ICV82_05485 [Nitrososphaera sp.]|nr:hypothetical protein [Nitrososphaera sp.]